VLLNLNFQEKRTEFLCFLLSFFFFHGSFKQGEKGILNKEHNKVAKENANRDGE
jgi:hypothetical protein